MPSERSEQGKEIASEARQFPLCGFTFPRWLPSAKRGNSFLMLSISLMVAARSEAFDTKFYFFLSCSPLMVYLLILF
jgi:hypothetical protein